MEGYRWEGASEGMRMEDTGGGVQVGMQVEECRWRGADEEVQVKGVGGDADGGYRWKGAGGDAGEPEDRLS